MLNTSLRHFQRLQNIAATLPLDQVSGAVAAYSLRKLSSSYTGPCIRVRRSSDNTELDIGFVNNALDTITLLSFCGSNSGYISKWYDQSGLNNHAVQITAASQPLIVNSGTIYTINNKPSLLFSTTQLLQIANNTSLQLTDLLSIDAVFNTTGFGGNALGRIVDKDILNAYGLSVIASSNGSLNFAVDNTSYATAYNSVVLGATQHSAVFFNKNTSSIIYYTNNLPQGTATRSTSIPVTATDMCIGNRVALDRGFNGYISEIIVRNIDQSAKIANIYASAKQYYNLP